jgi:PRTRC genetic system protein B
MNFDTTIVPHSMLVLYLKPTSPGGYMSSSHSAEDVYFEFADIVDGIPGAFAPLSNHAAAKFSKCFTAAASEDIGGFIPANMLYCSVAGVRTSVLWYTKPEKKRLLYNIGSEEFKTATFMMPWLVWYYHNGQLSIFAAKEQPNRATMLFRAPFSNISNEGIVCLGGGNIVLDKTITDYETLMNLLQAAFFGTFFTHQTSNCIKGNMLSLHKQLDGTDDPFPEDVLISHRKTINRLIYGKGKQEEDIEED